MASTTSSDGMDTIKRLLKHIWTEYSIVVVLVVIFFIAGLIAPRFMTVSNQLVILRHASIIGMIALGMTFVIITGGIDLSAGHVVAASGTVLIMLQGNENIPLPIAILACFAVSTSIGFLNGVVITKFRVPPFIVTLAIGIMVRSFALNMLQGRSISGRHVPEFTNIGGGFLGPIPNALIIWVVSAVILGCVLAYTKFGSYVYAVGGNENAAKYSGISTDRIKIFAYTLTGFCVGMAALLDFSRMAAIAAGTAGHMYEFDAITAAVVGGVALSGGRGKIMGAFFGMIIVSSVSNLMIMFRISPYLAGMLQGSIILAAVLLQRREKAA